jgi:hypothetical protein
LEISNSTNPVATTPASTTTTTPAESFTYTVQEGLTTRQVTSSVKLWETDPAVILERTTAVFMGSLLNLALYGAALETAGVGANDPVTTQIPAPTPTVPAPETAASAQSAATTPAATSAAAPAATLAAQTTAAAAAADDTGEEETAETPAEPVMLTVPTDQVLIANRLINRLDGDQNNVIDFEEAERNIQRFARPAEGQPSVLPTGAWGGTQGATDDLREALTSYMTRIAAFDADGDGQLEREELLAHLPFGLSSKA